MALLSFPVALLLAPYKQYCRPLDSTHHSSANHKLYQLRLPMVQGRAASTVSANGVPASEERRPPPGRQKY